MTCGRSVTGGRKAQQQCLLTRQHPQYIDQKNESQMSLTSFYDLHIFSGHSSVVVHGGSPLAKCGRTERSFVPLGEH